MFAKLKAKFQKRSNTDRLPESGGTVQAGAIEERKPSLTSSIKSGSSITTGPTTSAGVTRSPTGSSTQASVDTASAIAITTTTTTSVESMELHSPPKSPPRLTNTEARRRSRRSTAARSITPTSTTDGGGPGTPTTPEDDPFLQLASLHDSLQDLDVVAYSALRTILEAKLGKGAQLSRQEMLDFKRCSDTIATTYQRFMNLLAECSQVRLSKHVQLVPMEDVAPPYPKEEEAHKELSSDEEKRMLAQKQASTAKSGKAKAEVPTTGDPLSLANTKVMSTTGIENTYTDYNNKGIPLPSLDTVDVPTTTGPLASPATVTPATTIPSPNSILPVSAAPTGTLYVHSIASFEPHR